MSNLAGFAKEFFQGLRMREDQVNGHSFKVYMSGAVDAFLENETQDSAFAVYRAFFDCYRVTIPGRDGTFTDLIDMLRSYEATAATLIDKQRDHFIHSVNVFITGLAVFARNGNFREIFYCSKPEDGFRDAFEDPFEEFFLRWGIAALFHDVGYPVEIVGHQIDRFIRMVSDADGDEVRVRAKISYENFSELDHIKEVIPAAEFTKEYREAYAVGDDVDLLSPLDLMAHRIHLAFGTDLAQTRAFLDGFVEKMAESGFIDHGFYSAMIILKWYGYAMQLSGDPCGRFFWQITDSATAILLHNYYRNVLQKEPFGLGAMRAEDDPVAWLLILCDELQEWNREARGIITRTFTLADTVNLSLTDDYLAATYVTGEGSLPADFCAEKKALLNRVLGLADIFPSGLDVDSQSTGSMSLLVQKMSGATSRPLLRDIELLAIAIHARYNEKQLEDHPGEPLAYPNFSELPDELKYSNLRQAQSMYDKLDAFGFTLRAKGGAGAVTEFDAALTERMAEMEHDSWVAERLSLGWKYGLHDVDGRTSPYLVPYSELPDDIKDLDRDAVRNIPALADRIGMAVYKLAEIKL